MEEVHLNIIPQLVSGLLIFSLELNTQREAVILI